MVDLFDSAIILPAISMWQPWASLTFTIPVVKPDETRGYAYPAKYDGQQVAFHAASVMTPRRWITDAVEAICVDQFGSDWARTLPRGAVLGTHRLAGCRQSTEDIRAAADPKNVACGDWSPGRWLWSLDQSRLFSSPVPYKGKQGWFRFDMSLAT